MITTEGSQSLVLGAIAAGAKGYICKPFTADRSSSVSCRSYTPPVKSSRPQLRPRPVERLEQKDFMTNELRHWYTETRLPESMMIRRLDSTVFEVFEHMLGMTCCPVVRSYFTPTSPSPSASTGPVEAAAGCLRPRSSPRTMMKPLLGRVPDCTGVGSRRRRRRAMQHDRGKLEEPSAAVTGDRAPLSAHSHPQLRLQTNLRRRHTTGSETALQLQRQPAGHGAARSGVLGAISPRTGTAESSTAKRTGCPSTRKTPSACRRSSQS